MNLSHAIERKTEGSNMKETRKDMKRVNTTMEKQFNIGQIRAIPH